MGARLTYSEKEELIVKIKAELAANPNVSLRELASKIGYRGARLNGLARMLKSRFYSYYITSRGLATVNADSQMAKMAKALERMAEEIQFLQEENAQLRALKAGPVLSERARRALIQYGD